MGSPPPLPVGASAGHVTTGHIATGHIATGHVTTGHVTSGTPTGCIAAGDSIGRTTVIVVIVVQVAQDGLDPVASLDGRVGGEVELRGSLHPHLAADGPLEVKALRCQSLHRWRWK